MKWEELTQRLTEAYGKVAVWAFNHQVEVDTLVVLVVVGSCVMLWRRQRRQRSKAFRLIRGALMKRKDRERMHMMAFEDAICDRAMDMVAKGEMTAAEEKDWYEFFASNYGMTGLLNVRNAEAIKRALRFRLLIGHYRPIGEIPGPKPKDIRIDSNYQPVVLEIETRRMTSMSRYLNGGA